MVILQHLIVLGRLAVLIQKEPVEGEIDLQHREVFKILFGAINRQYLLDKIFPGDYFGAFGYPFLIAVFGVNLANPAGISIAGCPDEDLRMKVPEMEGFWIGLKGGMHEFSLDEKRGLLKWIDWALRKLGYSGQIWNF
jgi:hypothetical protein